MSANASVLTELLIRERQSLLRFLSRYLDRYSCEDTYQSIYIKLAKVPGEPPIKDARAYLYRVAYHQAVEHVRSESFQRRLADEAAAMLEQAQVIDGLQVVVAQHELQRVDGALRALPERTRRIFLLNCRDGLSAREIGRQLGISRNTVDKHMHRAMALVAAARQAP